MSLKIIFFLGLGVICGVFLPQNIVINTGLASDVLLCLLIFSIGIDIGLNKKVFSQLKKIGLKILILPVGTIIGTLLGGFIYSFFISESVRECLAIASGFGWYSLSGILITNMGYPISGTISFLSNVFREILTFIFVPVIASKLNYYAAVSIGGATSMDTTLGVITKFTDSKTGVMAFIHGVVLSMIVPVLIAFIL